MEKQISQIKKKAEDLIGLMGFEVDAIITQRGRTISLNLQVEEPGMLIGRGGEILESLEHILRVLLGEVTNEVGGVLVVDINGYRNGRISLLERRAREAAFEARDRKIEVLLEPMNSFERRIVHSLVSNIADVETESIGFGAKKKVKIKPKKK